MQRHRSFTGRQLILALALLLASLASAQQRSPDHETTTWDGMWIATAGPSRMFRGRWWASLTPGTHNAAGGSWTLLSESNQIILEGTWSARKAASGWQGTWSAKTGGASFSGTWTSNVPEINAKTFEDLLTATIHKQVAGSWQMGRLQGDWWLQGPQ
jgi:hypothetical protein